MLQENKARRISRKNVINYVKKMVEKDCLTRLRNTK